MYAQVKFVLVPLELKLAKAGGSNSRLQYKK